MATRDSGTVKDMDMQGTPVRETEAAGNKPYPLTEVPKDITKEDEMMISESTVELRVTTENAARGRKPKHGAVTCPRCKFVFRVETKVVAQSRPRMVPAGLEHLEYLDPSQEVRSSVARVRSPNSKRSIEERLSGLFSAHGAQQLMHRT